MKRVLVPTRSGNDWQRFLAKPTHWSPGRSAMSAAASWESANPSLPPEIGAALSATDNPTLADLTLLLAVPEWEVALPGGSTTSCTDILAVTTNDHGVAVIAVEAKVSESFGPTLGEKRHNASPGVKKRLGFLHRALHLNTDLPDDIRYQLLHRTVSAILTAKAFHAATAVMLVQSFCPDSSWLGDYVAFAQALGAQASAGSVTPVEGFENPSLFIGWVAGEKKFRDMDLRLAASHIE